MEAVILTHAHFDHASNAAAMKERYGMDIMIHESESALLANGQNPHVNGFVGGIRRILSRMANTFLMPIQYEPVHCDILIYDGLNLSQYDMNAYIIHTPGHTAGSVSVIVDNEVAIVGDAMYGVFPGSVCPPFVDNFTQMADSWVKLFEADCQIYLPAHGKKIGRELLSSQIKKYKSRK
jgi:glyoxylase-like metal-dependent hydrolase (beta-lactamase superfamily II)